MFEVMAFPASELDYWAVFFSIDDKKDKPTLPKITPENVTLEQSKAMMRNAMR